MRVQTLEIENFRGIKKMQIEFHPQLNIFVGKNGIGKTTILKALGKTIDIARLNHVTGNEKHELESWGIINFNDILVGANESFIGLHFLLEGKSIHTTVSSKPSELTSTLGTHFPESGVKLPHRAFSEDRSTITGTYSPNEKIRNLITEIDPIMGSIIKDTTQYGFSFAWISDREAKENSRLRKFIDSGKEFGKDHFEKDKTLHLIKKAIADITGFNGLFDDREKYGFTVRKNLENGEQPLLFSQLSSGEQHLISFIATIAVYLAACFSEQEEPLNGEAVFIIDAIELHLHPSWQRTIIPKLLRSFPNCQFIITTHSPQIIGNVKPESVFILKNIDNNVIYEKPNESYGMTMDRLLELVMEEVARPAASINKDLEILFELISRNEYEKACDILKEIKKDIPTDPELVRAEILLHRKGFQV